MMEMEIVFPGGKRVDAVAGSTVITTNQDGTAPQPFGLFLASIGTCAGIYVLQFCLHRNLPTEGIKLIQRTHKNADTKMIEAVDLDIQVPPDFPEKYRDALIRAVDQCAVKRHIQHPPQFNVQTVVTEPT